MLYIPFPTCLRKPGGVKQTKTLHYFMYTWRAYFVISGRVHVCSKVIKVKCTYVSYTFNHMSLQVLITHLSRKRKSYTLQHHDKPAYVNDSV